MPFQASKRELAPVFPLLYHKYEGYFDLLYYYRDKASGLSNLSLEIISCLYNYFTCLGSIYL